MSKKGGIEVQFNWIFVFIAGALIFTLILGFANRQAKSADQRIAARLVRDLNTVITQSSVSTGKSDVVDLIQDIQLFCDSTPNSCSKSGCASHIEIGSITAKTETITIFSAPSISQGKLLTWTQHWSVPFRVMNFVYLSNPRTKFAFVGNDPLLHQLYEEMPANTAQVSVSTPATTNNYILRLIYLNEDPTLPAGLTHAPDKEITALKIIPLDDSDGSEYGEVEFYKKVGSSMQSIGKSKYVGESTLYGAIYSTNIESYNCGLRKALVRLQKIAEIYKQKSMELGNLDTGCDEYGSMLSLINNIYSVADDLNIDQAQIIYENSKSLKEKNHALKINSCPTLY